MLTLTLERKDVELIGRALGNLPFNEVAQLIVKLQQQVTKQVTNDTNPTTDDSASSGTD